MEKTATKKKKGADEKAMKTAFIEFVLTEGRMPSSAFTFAKSLKMEESDFYTHYNSLGALERAIWSDWFKETLNVLKADDQYARFSVREKLLSFFFTWVEQVKSQRSYVLMRVGQTEKRDMAPEYLKDLRLDFDYFIDELIMEGKETGEIADRPITNQYKKGFWIQFLFILRHWADDDTRDFEKTDVAIEKSVNLALDLVGRGAIESIIDFAKFFISKPGR